jgi:hypothetical protein
MKPKHSRGTTPVTGSENPMEATLQSDGSIMLSSADEARIIQPDHSAYVELAMLYNSALTAAARDNLAEPEDAPPPAFPAGFGGFPWRSGTPEPGKTYAVPLEALHADPRRFQFRDSADNPLADQAFDPSLAGSLTVYKDSSRTCVVDGHRRLQIAQWSTEGVPTVPCRYVTDAKNADEARAIGALLNIARGTATAADIAKFLHGAGRTLADLAGANINLDEQTARAVTVLMGASRDRADQKEREKLHAARRRRAAIASAIAAREREATHRQGVASSLPGRDETPRGGEIGNAAQPGAGVGFECLLNIADLPEGWSIKAGGDQPGLFREGRDTPVATAATVDELVGRIAGAGRARSRKQNAKPRDVFALSTADAVFARVAPADISAEVQTSALRSLRAMFPLDDPDAPKPLALSAATKSPQMVNGEMTAEEARIYAEYRAIFDAASAG